MTFDTSLAGTAPSAPVWRRWDTLILVGMSLLAFGVFAATTSNTLSWWDATRYGTTTVDLGVAGAPGSLLLTLAGWIITKFAGPNTSLGLNLLAAVFAVTTIGLVFVIARRLDGNDTGGTAPIGIALGALTLAWSSSFWEYSVQFSPYMLTPIVTALILLLLVRWWQDAELAGSWRWLACVAFLVGIDLAVHRTNALLIPGILAWILLRAPRTLLSPRLWLVGGAAFIAGAMVLLLVIPMSAADPFINAGEPNTWARFWTWFNMEEIGGNPKIWPRNAPFWSVQVADVLRILRLNFAPVDGPLGVLGALPALSLLLGVNALWRRDRKLLLGGAIYFVLHFFATVLLWNIPAEYMRSLHRHYLPLFIPLAILVALGAQAAYLYIRRALESREVLGVAAGCCVAALLPLMQLAGNWKTRDTSDSHFAEDLATNFLQALPPNAILLTVGDNDTFPLWYMQRAKRLRTDVEVVNLSLLGTKWYGPQLIRRRSDFPIAGWDSQKAYTVKPGFKVSLPIQGDPSNFGLPSGFVLPDSMLVDTSAPIMSSQGAYYDVLLLTMLRQNHWQRPIYISGSFGELRGSLGQFSRNDGLYSQIVPYQSPPTNLDILRRTVDSLVLRDWEGKHFAIKDPEVAFGGLYIAAFVALGRAEAVAAGSSRCALLQQRALTLFAALPDMMQKGLREPVTTMCAPQTAGAVTAASSPIH